MVGELNLFCRTPTQLSPDDQALLDALASHLPSHLAGAIEGLRAAALQRETAVSEERSFIARELHESIAQSLAFLKIQLALLCTELKRQDPARIEKTLAELDGGVHESMDDVLPLPADVQVQVQVQVQVLHVVQEALSNVRKPARARERAFNGPGLVALIGRVQPDVAEVPAHEQWVCIGAALMNFLNVLHLMGFGAKALRGASVADLAIRAALCREDETLVSWIVAGRPTRAAPPKHGTAADAVIGDWLLASEPGSGS